MYNCIEPLTADYRPVCSRSPRQQPLSAHPELVEGRPAADKEIPGNLKILPAILQQVQDERIYGFPIKRKGR